MKRKDNVPLRIAVVLSGLRQFEVAARAGVCESQLSQFLSGRRQPTADQQTRLAKVLKRSVPELFGEAA
jgi:transcriptional regulator with XRE-family HTH domain